MHVSADLCNVSTTTAFNSIHLYIDELCKISPQFIKFPENLSRIEAKFRTKQGFPGVVGCIDGTHIKVWVPQSNSRETYRNRKGVFSLNVQMVCGPDCVVYDLVNSWPGSAHDSNVFNQSSICARLSNGEFGNYHLLGDSAYPLTPYLMTPYRKDDVTEKSNYLYLRF